MPTPGQSVCLGFPGLLPLDLGKPHPGASTLPGGQEMVETSIAGQLDWASVCRRRGFCSQPVSVLFKPLPKRPAESELQERLRTADAEWGGCMSHLPPGQQGPDLPAASVFVSS